MTSLRSRLLLLVGLVVVAALVLTAAVSSRLTGKRFTVFLEEQEETRGATEDARLVGELEHHAATHDGWAGVQATLDSLHQGNDEALILLDHRGTLVATAGLPPDRLRVARTTPDTVELTQTTAAEEMHLALTGGLPIRLASQVVGRLFVVPLPDEQPPPAATRFLHAVNRSLILVVLAIGVLALTATAVLATRLIRPLEELTAATRRMAAGDLGARVEIRGSDEVAHLGDAFNAMAAALERQENTRRRMVADTAHELRTPLTNLRGQLEAIQDGLLQPDQPVIASLHEEASHLERLVDDLQVLALADAGALPLSMVAVSLAAEIEQAAQSFRPLLDAAGGPSLVWESVSVAPVRADPARVQQILRNLLDNAIRHTPVGGRIEITTTRHGDLITVAVIDSGDGIAPEHLPHVFDRYYRADAARQRHTGGAGLGLAIVHELVSLHGGTVNVQNTPGAGAHVCFSLPVA